MVEILVLSLTVVIYRVDLMKKSNLRMLYILPCLLLSGCTDSRLSVLANTWLIVLYSILALGTGSIAAKYKDSASARVSLMFVLAAIFAILYRIGIFH